MDSATFLRTVFGPAPEGLILVWTLPNRVSRFFDRPEDAAGYARALEAYDVYVGVGLQARDLGPRQRGGARDVIALPGLWADIDIAGPAHAGSKRYPPDEAAAMELLDSLPVPPSLVVHSGHGLQPWWLFSRPWRLDTAAARAQAEARARGWIQTIQLAARARGWDIDAVGDLARVLRLPGSVNHKQAGAPAPVRVL